MRSGDYGTRTEIVAQAETVARAHGIDLTRYRRLSVTYQKKEIGGEWLVHFESKSPRRGSHFGVFVDDQSRISRYVEGR